MVEAETIDAAMMITRRPVYGVHDQDETKANLYHQEKPVKDEP